MLGGVVLLLIGMSGELILRVTGHQPWEYQRKSNEPVMFDPDPVLGWKNKPGQYFYSAYRSEGEPITVTILPAGNRSTGIGNPQGATMLVVGGSFVQGWGLSDEATFPWKLQQQYSNGRVVNFGIGGFGTYQSLLLLEKYLRTEPPPRVVLYGFMNHHEERNVAPWRWMRDLVQASQGGQVEFPYSEIEERGRVATQQSDRYPEWPFRETFASVNFLQELYMRVKTAKRSGQKREVTEQVLLEFDRLLQQHGTAFIVVVLDMERSRKTHYTEFFLRHHVAFLDCVYPVYPIPKALRIKGDWHPNGQVNSFWAHCISEGLGNEIPPSRDRAFQ